MLFPPSIYTITDCFFLRICALTPPITLFSRRLSQQRNKQSRVVYLVNKNSATSAGVRPFCNGRQTIL